MRVMLVGATAAAVTLNTIASTGARAAAATAGDRAATLANVQVVSARARSGARAVMDAVTTASRLVRVFIAVSEDERTGGEHPRVHAIVTRPGDVFVQVTRECATKDSGTHQGETATVSARRRSRAPGLHRRR